MPTVGAFGGVVCVLVEPTVIDDDFATAAPSCSWATIRPIAAIATAALAPTVARHILSSPRALFLC